MNEIRTITKAKIKQAESANLKSIATNKLYRVLIVCAPKHEMFFRATPNARDGSGLGLFICKERKKFCFEIPRPKKPSKLPKAISQKDIKKIFEVTSNLKHNTMLKLCYGMGLRVSGIVNLKIADIDSEHMQVFIEQAKGKKDRYVNLPQSILEQLREYYLQYKPKKYLFEGQYG